MTWTRIESKDKEATENLGKYFVRTSMDMKDEVIVWNVYNTIREIESTFRTLKTDLDLRPIYHKKDESTIAHLNLGLLAYWLVNTLRCQLISRTFNRFTLCLISYFKQITCRNHKGIYRLNFVYPWFDTIFYCKRMIV